MMLRRFIVTAAALAAVAGPALAQGRPDARTMSCGQVHGLIDQRGSAVLTTGRYTYDRYVADRRFCMMEETVRTVSILTRDTDDCRVYLCELDSRDPIWDRGN
ncbi:hypothetical protein HK436_13990 [Mesorhizobium sediminum]|nr:hypothetical protein [Mesorhizobium sediminum]